MNRFYSGDRHHHEHGILPRYAHGAAGHRGRHMPFVRSIALAVLGSPLVRVQEGLLFPRGSSASQIFHIH
jgi:hypothetical protein